MTKKEQLMRRIQASKFVAWEIKIYLDTHPSDRNALRRLREEEEKLQALKEEYEENYGPIEESGENRWAWINSPWPWETGEGEEET